MSNEHKSNTPGAIKDSWQNPVNGNNKGSVLFIWRGHCKSHCVSLVDRSEYC